LVWKKRWRWSWGFFGWGGGKVILDEEEWEVEVVMKDLGIEGIILQVGVIMLYPLWMVWFSLD
jgi:hypothetical protein